MVEEIKLSNRLKFENCSHVHEYLLHTKGCIVEVTNNLFWGLGLPPDMTKSMLKDYWPGKNNLRLILMDLHEELTKGGGTETCKATSPLDRNLKNQ